MENLPFDYQGLEKNHKICTEFSDVAESFAAVLGWVCLKIVLDTVVDMVSFYLHHIQHAWNGPFALYITESSLNCYCC